MNLRGLTEIPTRSFLWLLAAACFSLYFSVARAITPVEIQHLMQMSYGNPGVERLNAWRDLLRTSARLSELEKVGAVNMFFNRTIALIESQGSSKTAMKTPGYSTGDWASPLHTLGSGVGDCRGYALGKYFSLLQLGIPANRLRLIYTKAQVGEAETQPQTHMVLAYYAPENADPLILDNLRDDVQPAFERRDLLPLFSLSAHKNYAGEFHQRPYLQGRLQTSLSPWQALLKRSAEEGFY